MPLSEEKEVNREGGIRLSRQIKKTSPGAIFLSCTYLLKHK
jgi:hypothetical protein